MKIIFEDNDYYYYMTLILSEQDTLESRRAQLTERFFRRSVLCEASCLHYLLPEERDSSVTDRLRHAKTFQHIPASIGAADSTGAAGKLPGYPRNNRGKSIIFPGAILPPICNQMIILGLSIHNKLHNALFNVVLQL